MITARSSQGPRSLDDFDAASNRGCVELRALDTSVLVRYFINDPDDPQSAAQQPAAIAAFEAPAFVPITVTLEFERVLRGLYTLGRDDVVQTLRSLAGLKHIEIEDRVGVIGAIDALEGGLDFTDAIHLQRCRGVASFATFDRRLAKNARALVGGDLTQVELLQ